MYTDLHTLWIHLQTTVIHACCLATYSVTQKPKLCNLRMDSLINSVFVCMCVCVFVCEHVYVCVCIQSLVTAGLGAGLVEGFFITPFERVKVYIQAQKNRMSEVSYNVVAV